MGITFISIDTCRYPFPKNTPTKKEGISMDSKLIQEVRLDLQRNKLLKQIDYQLEHPVECRYRNKTMCKQCIYNVGSIVSICSKVE